MLYAGYMRLRRSAYRRGWLKSTRLSLPVIVVGNLSVGGTGKSPLVRAIVAGLRQRGYRPGIVARGYGGQASDWPVVVRPDSDPVEVGDEPVEHAMLSDAAGVAVAPSRVAAVNSLIESTDCDVIVADDGLQHLALARDIDIVVVDSQQGFGNGRCLPAGPLREATSVLNQVDHVVVNSLEQQHGEPAGNPAIAELRDLPRSVKCWYGQFVAGTIEAADGTDRTVQIDALNATASVSVCGVGNPARFEAMLRQLGIALSACHRFPDHHKFSPQDFDIGADAQILMTMKDAVKCRAWFGDHPQIARRCWSVPVACVVEPDFIDAIVSQLAAARP